MTKTKRILSLILSSIMIMSTAASVSAEGISTSNTGDNEVIVSYGVSESFIVTIPADIAIDASTNSAMAEVTASNVMIASNKSLKVKINGTDDDASWKLKDVEHPDNTLNYIIGSSEGENNIVNNSVVLTAKAGEYFDSDVTATLYFTVTDELTKSGNYNDMLTFTAELFEVIKLVNQGSGADYRYQNQTRTLNNIEIDTTGNNGTYPGLAGFVGEFNNCIITGTLALYNDAIFKDCVFIVTGDKYNVWTWGSKNVTFENCTFICDGKAMLIYGNTQNITTYTFNNCKFYDVGNDNVTKAAIEIGNDYGAAYNVIINNISVSGFAPNDKNALYENIVGNKNSMTQEKLNVVIDEVDVY